MHLVLLLCLTELYDPSPIRGLLETQAHRLPPFRSQSQIKLASWQESVFQNFLKMATHAPLSTLGLISSDPQSISVSQSLMEEMEAGPPVFPHQLITSSSSSFLTVSLKTNKNETTGSHRRSGWPQTLV